MGRVDGEDHQRCKRGFQSGILGVLVSDLWMGRGYCGGDLDGTNAAKEDMDYED